MKSPAFQWYPKDILSSKRVALMTLAEEAAYRRAIDFCWLHGSLPADVKQLAMMIGKGCTTKIAEKVSTMFIEQNGELRHDRLDAEREKQSGYRKGASKGGKASATKRWGNENVTAVTNPLQNTGNPNVTAVTNPLQNTGNPNVTAVTNPLQNTGNPNVTAVTNPLQDTGNPNVTLHTANCILHTTSAKSTTIQIPAGDGKKIIEKTEVKVDLPWPSIAFAAMWQNWKNFRAAEKRVKFKTPESELAQLKHLHGLAFGDEQTAIQIIEQSIGNQWTGLFQISNKNYAKNTNTATGNTNGKTPLWRR